MTSTDGTAKGFRLTTFQANRDPVLNSIMDGAHERRTGADRLSSSSSEDPNEEEATQRTGSDSSSSHCTEDFEEEDRYAAEKEGEVAKAMGDDEQPRKLLIRETNGLLANTRRADS